MILAIDAGNTFVKYTSINTETNEIGAINQIEYEKFENIIDILFSELNYSTWILADSAGISDRLIPILNKYKQGIKINGLLNLPFKNNYQTPSTQGADRIALLAGASQLFSDKNKLILSIGTCLTVDFLNNKNEYLGGSIHPGLDMRAKAMHHFTGKLPYFKPEPTNLNGLSTADCLKSGAINGMLFEILGIIDAYQKKFESMALIITGGDKHYFDNKIKQPIFASDTIMFVGINAIYKLNRLS